MSLITLGINYKTAPVEIRERVAFTPENIESSLKEIQHQCDVDEVVILSTCNRTEFYIYAQTEEIKPRITQWLAKQSKLSADELDSYIYEYSERETVNHVLRVASGVDSMILGEPQILGQIKDAYRYSVQAGTVSTLLSRLFQFTFTVAKQIRTDTLIGSSPVSVAFTAVNLAKQIFGELSSYTALFIGAGETIELAARYLHDQEVGRVIVANRTVQRAHDLASNFNGYAIGLDEIPAHISEADIVISSTASREPILLLPTIQKALADRKNRLMFLVDLAVPRDIDPAICDLNDVYLYTIDDLQNVVNENLESRKEAASKAEEIIGVQIEQFLGWRKSLEAVETICALRSDAELKRDETLEKALQFLQRGKSPEEALHFLAHTLTNKIIHAPSTSLKQAGSQGRTELIKSAREIFDLQASNGSRADDKQDSNHTKNQHKNANKTPDKNR